ncbi:MAG: hypothetical protein JO022_12660 [Acidobacteriaceae bacterium]|nr:hypothetical protein [Acidobacteriaceae bacterium]
MTQPAAPSSSAGFAAHKNSEFLVVLDEASSVPLQLQEVNVSEVAGLDQFSLLFHGPLTPALPQAIRTLRHAEMAESQLFLVPLGPCGSAMRYEAIFNRIQAAKEAHS